MARIRSIHPGLRTDEAFMALSFAARDFLSGLWMEADDHGVFVWKPLTLKARIFPADNVDVVALLAELTTHLWVKSFTVDGTTYGICRKFRKWQRPKSPTYQHPFPQEFGSYICLNTTPSEDPPQDEPTTSESSPQREDGGGRMKEEKKESEGAGEEFDAWWEVQPNKVGKPVALRDYAAARKKVSAEILLSGLKRYVATKPADRQWLNPSTWLNQERWNDTPAVVGVAVDQLTDPVKTINGRSEIAWRNACKAFAANRFWPGIFGAEPGKDDCQCPAHILAEVFGQEALKRTA